MKPPLPADIPAALRSCRISAHTVGCIVRRETFPTAWPNVARYLGVGPQTLQRMWEAGLLETDPTTELGQSREQKKAKRIAAGLQRKRQRLAAIDRQLTQLESQRTRFNEERKRLEEILNPTYMADNNVSEFTDEKAEQTWQTAVDTLTDLCIAEKTSTSPTRRAFILTLRVYADNMEPLLAPENDE